MISSVDEQINFLHSAVTSFSLKRGSELSKLMDAEIKALQSRKIECGKDPAVNDLLSIGVVLQCCVTEIPSTIALQLATDIAIRNRKQTKEADEELLTRLRKYDKAQETLSTTVQSFVSSPNALLHHIKSQIQKQGTGTALYCTLGGVIGAVLGGVCRRTLLGVLSGGACGVLVALIAYGVYRWYSTPADKTERERLEERLRSLRKSDTYESLVAITKDLEVFCTKPGMNTPGNDGAACAVCKETMQTCTHYEGQPHHDRCSVSGFQCKHTFCNKCAQDPRVSKCPLCRAPRRQR